MNFRKSPKQKQKNDIEKLGFSSKMNETRSRLIHKDGTFNIERIGRKSFNPYQGLVETSWWKFFLFVFVLVIILNAFFAGLFVLIGTEDLAGIEKGHSLFGDFVHAFFFSVQTFTTVGYGAINPTGIGANIVSSVDALIGLLTFALFTGLFFARFSRPRASILFSDKALISTLPDGKDSFQFRIANRRDHKIIDLEAKVLVTWLEKESGVFYRKYASLKLERDKIFLFPLNWTIVHPIDDKSPLFDKTKQELIKMQAEFLVLVEGYDESFAQKVHANRSYFCDDLIWNANFEIMHRPEKGKTVLDLDKINDLK